MTILVLRLCCLLPNLQERHTILWKEAGRWLSSVVTADHLCKEVYCTRVPSQVRGLLSGDMADAAVIVVADLQGHSPQAEMEKTVCDTMALLPEAAKLLLFTDVPPRRHKTEKSVQMPSSMQVDTEQDESDGDSEEQVPEQVLPAVRAEGHVRLTLPEKQRLLAEHRKSLSKQLSETFGDGVNQHYELPFTLLFNSPMQGRLTMDGLLVQPIKGLSWLDGTCLSSGGTGIMQRPDKVVKFSKEAARNMRKMQCGATSVARNSVSEGQRLQKGPGICGHVLRSLRLSLTRQKLHKAGLVVVDLCCSHGDWLLAVVAEVMNMDLPDRYDMLDDEVPLDGLPDMAIKYVGFDTREYAVGFASARAQGEIFERLSASELGYAAPPVVPDDKTEPVWQNLVAEVNRQLKILKVKNKDGSLIVPPGKTFKLQREAVLDVLETVRRAAANKGPRFGEAEKEKKPATQPVMACMPVSELWAMPHVEVTAYEAEDEPNPLKTVIVQKSEEDGSGWQLWLANPTGDLLQLKKKSPVVPLGQLAIVEEAPSHSFSLPFEVTGMNNILGFVIDGEPFFLTVTQTLKKNDIVVDSANKAASQICFPSLWCMSTQQRYVHVITCVFSCRPRL